MSMAVLMGAPLLSTSWAVHVPTGIEPGRTALKAPPLADRLARTILLLLSVLPRVLGATKRTDTCVVLRLSSSPAQRRVSPGLTSVLHQNSGLSQPAPEDVVVGPS